MTQHCNSTTFSQFMFRIFIVLIIIWQSGCTKVGPDFQLPVQSPPTTWSQEENDLFKSPSQPDSVAWWEHFNDPLLNTLIRTAYEQNLTLRTAAIRILESRAQLARVRGNIYPQSQNINGNIFTTGTPETGADRYFNSISTGFDVAWEMDFWGKFRRSIESADANLMVSMADYEDLLVSLTAEVARTYVDIRTVQERIKLAQTNAELQEKSLRLVTLQFEAGVVTELDILQAKTLLYSTLTTIPSFEATLATYINSLGVLLGMMPEEVSLLIQPEGNVPDFTSQVALTIPAQLLRRRPDIRRSEMAAAAQSEQIGIARTELLPSFTLFGSIGWSADDAGSNSLDDLFDSNSFSYNFGPGFTWSVFNYGRLKNEVRIQDARFQQAVIRYQETVLNAAREVEDAMQSLVHSRKEAELLKKSVETSRRSAELSMLQYTEGLADYQRVLDSIRAVTQKEDQYAQTTGKIANFTIALYKAFGGGWNISEKEPYLPDEVRDEMESRTDWGTLLSPVPTATE
ncbi:efflux transporter outer membrane subunit [Desulfosediminicola flagellatus]|uniref:efflux transporter outer membrane subunit n=1 Tax=Desulfosediminicola flagellatus TaxID=2569541 RepID=UPI001C3C670B|nr:efflux transporter outer membrane subunit [Desulfosediminicola flagellatus]